MRLLLKDHEQHEGELLVQARRQVPKEVSQFLERLVSDEMPDQHASFFANLPYVAVAALDAEGRPWTTLLVADPAAGAPMVRVTLPDTLEARSSLPQDDPFARCMQVKESKDSNKLFAMLGVDFTNRRRNKAAGVVTEYKGTAAAFSMTLVTTENLGNCPKYITLRDLEHCRRQPETIVNAWHDDKGASIASCLDTIAQASSIFLATKHVDKKAERSDVGLNHRGGAPGFVRVYADEAGQWHLVIPDYSGNRFYQSLGNIQTDGQAGVLFPNFQTGDMCHVTGKAVNLFDEEAAALMPGMSLITKVEITGVVFIKGGLNLAQTSPDTFSPYNPQVKYLAHESAAAASMLNPSNTATLVSIHPVSSTSAEFTFELDTPVPPFPPGACIVLSFAHTIQRNYSHMNERKPQALNDDYIRTWTISAVKDNQITCTIKKVSSGAISPLLHSLTRTNPLPRLRLPCLGISSNFSCFNDDGTVPKKMLWIAGGVGLTPFLAFHQAIVARNIETDITLLFAYSGDDHRLLDPILRSGRVSVIAFTSSGKSEKNPAVSTVARRMRAADLAPFSDRQAYLCGPATLSANVNTWLQDAGCPGVHQEKFTF
ncbi:hypothetical protein BJ741DRAFT_587537 [Chytriomyces cf. hyalinus JEL632]|nr:hypothetical protein BJ741DRAFT_587537 [Chytriomyces cf. hyalinus JEL632]